MNKASGGDGILVELFQILKDDAWKCYSQYASKLGKLSSGQGLEKVSFIPILKKGNAKEHSNYCTIALISHASKLMLKILQARLQPYVSWELPDVQAGFRKGRGIRDQIANICWIIEKAREFLKYIISASLTTLKALTVWITTNWKILQEMGMPDYLTYLLRNLYADQEAIVRTGYRTTDWF